MAREFECDPEKYCGNAECCRSKDTVPGLGVGDLYRLSSYTREPIVHLWHTKGDVCLTESKGSNEFPVNLGLLHDPCPYLNRDHSCSVYEARPLGCATFPLNLFLPSKLNQSDPFIKDLCVWKELNLLLNN